MSFGGNDPQWQRCDDVIATDVDGGMVIFSIDTNNYISFNATAKAIWDIIFEPKTVPSIAQALADKFDVDLDTATAATDRLLADLSREGVIRKAQPEPIAVP